MKSDDHRRFPLTFNLRLLLVSLLGVAVGCGYLAREIRLAKTERSQLATLEKLGAVFPTYKYQFNREGSVIPGVRPNKLASWLGSLTGNPPIHRGVRWLEITADESASDLDPQQLLEIQSALSSFKDLEIFVSDTYPFKTLDAFRGMSNLKHLSIDAEPESIDAIANLEKLERLVLGNCWRLDDVSALANCDQLIALDIGGSEALTDLLPLKSLIQLEHLDLSTTDTLKSLAGIESMSKLNRLELRRCENLVDIDAIKSLKNLVSLSLTAAHEDCDLRILSRLSLLETLRLNGNQGIDLTSLRGLNRLRVLHLDDCNLTSLEGLQTLKNLEEISVSRNPIAADGLIAIAGLTQLKTIIVAGCNLTQQQIFDLQGSLPNTKVVADLGF